MSTLRTINTILVIFLIACVVLGYEQVKKGNLRAEKPPDRFRVMYFQGEDNGSKRIIEDTITKRQYLWVRENGSGGICELKGSIK